MAGTPAGRLTGVSDAPANSAGQTATRTQCLDQIPTKRYAGLLGALAVPESSVLSARNTQHPASDIPALGGTVVRVPFGSFLLGPCVAPPQEELCRRWIEARLNVKLQPTVTLAEHLCSGELLCRLLSERPRMSQAHSTVAWRIGQSNLLQFLRRARKEGVAETDLFQVDDLLLRRNVPRVLRTIAAVARKTDGDNFARLAGEVPGSSLQWTEADEPDERWRGDTLLSELAMTFRRVSGRRRMSIAVLGTMGAGKSATINLLMGRKGAIESHNLHLEPHRNDLDPGLRERERKLNHVMAYFWPLRFLEPGPHPSNTPRKCFVNVCGVSVSIVELPSTESYTTDSQGDGSLVSSAEAGSVDSVREALEHEQVDIILLVERLDEFRFRDYKLLYRRLQGLFGPKGWDRTVVVFSHGYSFPPEGLTAEEHIRRRTHLVQEHIHQISGNPATFLPVVVVENSAKCPVDERSGEPVLRDGVAFLPPLLNALKSVVTKSHSAKPISLQKARPWWEAWVFGLGALWLMNQL